METNNNNNEIEIKYTYENCWKFIIRPPRDDYLISELDFDLYQIQKSDFIYIREDYSILSKQGFLMECSFFRADLSKRKPFIRPVIIYLHGNSSSRVEGKKLAYYLLNKGFDLFVFDFPGCGKSEGEYISLGFHEKDDVGIIVDFIEKFPGVGNIGIWGRSMGAATALMYSHMDKRIKAMCVDSPFAVFRDLAIKLCKKHMTIPEFIINTILYFLKKTIKKKNGLDLETLKPIDSAEISKTPAFFIHAMKDDLIPYEHTIQIYEKYAGIKSINIVEGNHNTPRQKHLINKIVNFFGKYLDKNYKEENNEIEDDDENEEYEEQGDNEFDNNINEDDNTINTNIFS